MERAIDVGSMNMSERKIFMPANFLVYLVSIKLLKVTTNRSNLEGNDLKWIVDINHRQIVDIRSSSFCLLNSGHENFLR